MYWGPVLNGRQFAILNILLKYRPGVKLFYTVINYGVYGPVRFIIPRSLPSYFTLFNVEVLKPSYLGSYNKLTYYLLGGTGASPRLCI